METEVEVAAPVEVVEEVAPIVVDEAAQQSLEEVGVVLPAEEVTPI